MNIETPEMFEELLYNSFLSLHQQNSLNDHSLFYINEQSVNISKVF